MAAPYDEEMLVMAIENDDENMILHQLELADSRRSGLVTYDPDITFNLEELSDDQCLSLFRFDKENLKRLSTALRIPERFVCENRTVVEGVDALCILLRRLAYPNRLSDLERVFGRPKSTLSLVIKDTVDFLYGTHGHMLQNMDQPWMTRDALQTYADVIHARGAPLVNCFGFLDGTVRAMCRPGINQRVCYNGHKRVHALKFQSVILPNGMIANLYGPVEGRRHDCALLRLSGLIDQFEARPLYTVNGQRFAVYGDPAYPLKEYILCPFKGANLTPEEGQFNSQMSSVRECVEWGFGKIVQLWAFLDFKKNLKLLLQPVAKYYILGGLLTNCHTCVYGSQTSDYFDLAPPTLEDYLR